jgi:hypothetical protein
MPQADFPDPDAPEFAGVRADLGRLFIRHRAELGMLDWPEEEVVARTAARR